MELGVFLLVPEAEVRGPVSLLQLRPRWEGPGARDAQTLIAFFLRWP